MSEIVGIVALAITQRLHLFEAKTPFNEAMPIFYLYFDVVRDHKHFSIFFSVSTSGTEFVLLPPSHQRIFKKKSSNFQETVLEVVT